MGSWDWYPDFDYRTWLRMQAEIKGLRKQVKFLVNEAASWQTEVEVLAERDCADELALRDAAIEGLRKQVAISEGRLNAFKAAHELLQDFHADNKTELEQTRAELAAANERIVTLEDADARLMQSNTEAWALRSAQDEEIRSLKAELAEANAEADAAVEKIVDLTNKVEQLQHDLANYQEKAMFVDQYRSENIDLTKQLDAAIAGRNAAVGIKRTALETVAQFRRQVNEMRRRITELESDRDTKPGTNGNAEIRQVIIDDPLSPGDDNAPEPFRVPDGYRRLRGNSYLKPGDLVLEDGEWVDVSATWHGNRASILSVPVARPT